jgi:hypothetical protein
MKVIYQNRERVESFTDMRKLSIWKENGFSFFPVRMYTGRIQNICGEVQKLIPGSSETYTEKCRAHIPGSVQKSTEKFSNKY